VTCRVATLRLAAGYNHRPVGVKKPSVGALLLGLIPFVAMCLSVSIWDRIIPKLAVAVTVLLPRVKFVFSNCFRIRSTAVFVPEFLSS
jgi:hypothetical protein